MNQIRKRCHHWYLRSKILYSVGFEIVCIHNTIPSIISANSLILVCELTVVVDLVYLVAL